MTMPSFDTKLLERLRSLSDKGHYDPYTRFNWVPDIDRTIAWCDEDLLTTFGTTVHASLTERDIISLSHWECINFFSLNVHGIKDALQFVTQCMYEKRYANLSEYMHIFMVEENAHMWFFAKFCLEYAQKIYPSIPLPRSESHSAAERDLYMFASTLIFEEYVDFYNAKVGNNKVVPEIVREVNRQHHLDESRHISFGRSVVKALYANILELQNAEETAVRVSNVIGRVFRYFIGLMYNARVYEDAGIVASSGLGNAAALRNHLRSDPSRRTYHDQWFKRTATFFVNNGMLTDTSCLA